MTERGVDPVDWMGSVELEDLVREPHCHFGKLGSDRLGCGMPQCEGQTHDGRLVWPADLERGFCNFCGREWCPSCAARYWELWSERT